MTTDSEIKMALSSRASAKLKLTEKFEAEGDGWLKDWLRDHAEAHPLVMEFFRATDEVRRVLDERAMELGMDPRENWRTLESAGIAECMSDQEVETC